MVTLAICDAGIFDTSSKTEIAAVIPLLGSSVVGVL
jgi:hypothetical protein